MFDSRSSMMAFVGQDTGFANSGKSIWYYKEKSDRATLVTGPDLLESYSGLYLSEGKWF